MLYNTIMMNKFLVFPCIKQSNENGYNGPVVVLACASNVSFALFFPMSEENATMINYILEHKPSEYNSNQSVIGIYKTMLESWEDGGRFLSGIHLGTEFDPESKEETISVKLIISDEDGAVDSITRVNFIHAVLLAAMERKEILIDTALLKKLMPHEDDEDDEDEANPTHTMPSHDKKFPVDKDILEIAKKIMSGKIK
jgi:hypothetical protein